MRYIKLKIKCFIYGHGYSATQWLNDDPYDPRHIIYCTQCGKKRIETYAE